MSRRFKILNEREQTLAIVILFFEEEIKHFVGIITLSTLEDHAISLYENDDNIDIIIADLTPKVRIDHYHNYIELPNN